MTDKVKLTALKAIIFPLVLSVLSFGCAPQRDHIVTLTGPTMGTVYQVKFLQKYPVHSDLDSNVLKAQIDKTLTDINQLMSTYIPDSELSRLNKAPAEEPFLVSEETMFVLQEAIRLNQISQGALDITVGPLVNMWGFGPQMRPKSIPSNEALEEVRAYIGIDKFSIENASVIKHHDDVYIDLSTIAKGYAVDRLAELLEHNGIVNYLVDIGGEMRVSGSKDNDTPWRIAIEKPVSSERSVQSVIVIGDNAIATSGDYRNYFEENGVRYSHLIDPNTLKPIQHNLVSVSVITDRSMTADGLATALIVLGKERGLAIAEQHNIAALFIVKQDERFVEYRSTAFNAIIPVD